MGKNMIYLDYNATAPLLPHIAQAMHEVAQNIYGNPSSPHHFGRDARAILEQSRANIANCLDVPKQQIYFTSGGSESNNTVLRQCLLTEKHQHIITSQIEHPSILETCHLLENRSHIEITYLPVTAAGYVEPQSLKDAIRQDTSLISIMTANNETGMIQPISELAAIANESDIPFHTDSVQALGKIFIDWKAWNVDFATVTAHKIGGPKGIGLSYCKQGSEFHPLISGGKQERVHRAGTESVMLAHGFSKAIEWITSHLRENTQKMELFKSQVTQTLQNIDGFFINGTSPALPNTINIGFEGLSAESILIFLDLDGIAVSTGSACSSGAIEASHVLMAMGLSKTKAKSCLRVSMGWTTTQDDIEHFLDRIQYHVKRLYQKKQ